MPKEDVKHRKEGSRGALTYSTSFLGGDTVCSSLDLIDSIPTTNTSLTPGALMLVVHLFLWPCCINSSEKV